MLFIEQECFVPSEEGGAGRWAIDHLFLDQDGIPTIVEVKRSTDTRIRREVVGQMLDYASNAVAHGPVPHLRERFAPNCERAQGPSYTLFPIAVVSRGVKDCKDGNESILHLIDNPVGKPMR